VTEAFITLLVSIVKTENDVATQLGYIKFFMKCHVCMSLVIFYIDCSFHTRWLQLRHF